MTWDGRERRTRRRYGVKGSSVRWRPGPPLGWVAPSSVPHLLIDLSLDGCRFLSPVALDPGRRLALSIEASPGVTSRSGGVVAWSRRAEDQGAWLTGIAMKCGPAAAASLKAALDGAVLERIELTSRRFLKETGRA